MTQIKRDDLLDLMRLSRFADYEDPSTRYPGTFFPWSSGARVMATDARILVWLNTQVQLEPTGRVPDLMNVIQSAESVVDWEPLSMSHPVCEDCSDPDETCEFCTTFILEKKFNLNHVLSVQNAFGIDGVAIVDESNLAIKFKNGFAYLMGKRVKD